MSEADIAASLYGSPATATTAVVDEAASVSVSSEEDGAARSAQPGTATATPAAPAATTPPAETEPSSAADSSTDTRVAAKMVQNRLRQLRWLCAALVCCAAVALIVPSAPWYHFTAESTTVMLDAPGGGFEYFTTDAADMTRSGRSEGATEPALILAVAAVAAAFAASKRWWFAIPVILFGALGSGRALPPRSDAATTLVGTEVANSSLSTPQWGITAAVGLYWLTFALIALAGVSALIVRHSEHRLTRVTTGDPGAGGIREILSRYVVSGLARVGVSISDAVTAERERRTDQPAKK